MPLPYETFADSIHAAMNEWAQKPRETEEKLQAQVAYFKTHYQWAQRVKPWREFLESCS
jgi:hypothetical protein